LNFVLGCLRIRVRLSSRIIGIVGVNVAVVLGLRGLRWYFVRLRQFSIKLVKPLSHDGLDCLLYGLANQPVDGTSRDTGIAALPALRYLLIDLVDVVVEVLVTEL
jgi:hypothetical protein